MEQLWAHFFERIIVRVKPFLKIVQSHTTIHEAAVNSLFPQIANCILEFCGHLFVILSQNPNMFTVIDRFPDFGIHHFKSNRLYHGF